MFKVNNEDIKTTSLTLFAVFIVNVEYISHLCLMLFLFFFTLNRQMFPATLYYLIVIMEAATSTFDNIFRK